MKNVRAIFVSLILALVAFFTLAFYTKRVEEEARGKFEMIEILVAATEIPRYERIEKDMLAVKKIPKPYVQPMAIPLVDMKKIVGYYMADSTIREGEQILDTKLALIGETGISQIIEEGYRACTASINEVTGVGGHIGTRDKVDVIGTFRIVDEKTRLPTNVEATTLFQNVRVLAVGRNYIADRPESASGGSKKSLLAAAQRGTNFSNITLQLTQRQCMDLAVAQQLGEITLTLRYFGDRLTAKPDPTLRDKRSTPATATGIENPIQITQQPKWLEMRGEQGMVVP